MEKVKCDSEVLEDVRYLLGHGDEEEARKFLHVHGCLNKEDVDAILDSLVPMSSDEMIEHMSSA